MPETKDAITFTIISKWAGIVGSIITAVIGCVWIIANLKSEQAQNRSDLLSALQKLASDIGANDARHSSEEKSIRDHISERREYWERRVGSDEDDIATLKKNDQERVQRISDMAAKLDTMKVLLERIDKKLGNP